LLKTRRPEEEKGGSSAKSPEIICMVFRGKLVRRDPGRGEKRGGSKNRKGGSEKLEKREEKKKVG